MTPPRTGSVDGQYGYPIVEAKRVRVFVDGDMPRGVTAYNVDEGWADVLTYGDQGELLTNGAGVFLTRRIAGKVEVFIV